MREVEIREYHSKERNLVPAPTGNWNGPFLFHEWGNYQGSTMAIIEDPKTGECSMAYPGQMRFKKEQVCQTAQL